jgi:hypothetical protein
MPGEGRTLGLILFTIGAPMFLGFYLISLDTRPDLSDCQPGIGRTANDAIPLGWPALSQPGYFPKSRHPENLLPENGTVVEMLGYMMDGYKYARDGVPVAMFVLMPGAGHFMHPAHRDPDQMVEVWPKPGHVVFKNRELVRASGTFVRVPGPLREEHAQYALYNASVTPASYGDIANWFVP